MKVVRLEAENFKALRAVEITPEGDLVTIGGRNGQGKSSVLDAIWVALSGRAAAPPRPIREGAEQCRIVLDLGELQITRTFTRKESERYTDTLKVEDPEGRRYGQPQQVLDALLGSIGFDPLEFCNMTPGAQAQTLLELVPLPIDLDELMTADESDFLNRRDVNREIDVLKGQLAGMPAGDALVEVPDREALMQQLANAADVNSSIERERIKRRDENNAILDIRDTAQAAKDQAKRLREDADRQDAIMRENDSEAASRRDAFDALPPIAEPVDTNQLRDQIAEAERLEGRAAVARRRAEIEAELALKSARSKQYTDQLAEREQQREQALAAAKMPIDGLGFQINEKGKPVVTFNGLPFNQISSHEQIRASTAIAMAANPELRVLRIQDGSLLDEDSLRRIAEQASEGDFQLWIEIVGTGGVGFVIEDGKVKQ